MTQNTDLIERLEAAEAGTRALDGYLCAALSQQPGWATKNHAPRQPELWTDGGPGFRAREWTCPRYTTSLDAALALAERVLPGSEWRAGSGDGTRTRPWARLGPWSDPDATAATPALALCIAVLKARLSLTLEGEGGALRPPASVPGLPAERPAANHQGDR